MLTFTALIYICPMGNMGQMERVMMGTESICQSGMVGSGMGMPLGCVAAHLAAVEKLLGSMPNIVNLVVLAVLLTVWFAISARLWLASAWVGQFTRWRHFHCQYFLKIKLLLGRCFLKYLNLVGSNLVVSSV